MRRNGGGGYVSETSFELNTATDYQQWVDSFWFPPDSENPDIVGAEIDRDSDNKTNAEEYAYLGNPRIADPPPPG